MNETFIIPAVLPSNMTVMVAQPAISLEAGLLIFLGFVILAFFYVVVTKEKEKYEHWTNPRGRQVNLYKIIHQLFWAYVAMVIIICFYLMVFG